MQKPMFCGSSPTSLKRAFGDNPIPPLLKTIKLPEHTNKKPLYNLCIITNDLLQYWGYQKQVTVEAFIKITCQGYLEICSVSLTSCSHRAIYG